MESKINPDKKPILDRLMYLIASDGTTVVQNNRKNIPKSNSGRLSLVGSAEGGSSSGAIDYSKVKYGVGISALQATNMDFSKSDIQSLSFIIGFGDAIYDEVGKTSLLSRNDTFGFQIKNVTSGYRSDSADYFPVYGGAKQIFEVGPDFFGNKNGVHHIRLQLMSLKINRYENYFNTQNLTEFDVNVTGLSTIKKKSVSDENVDYCKTQIGDVTYSLDPCGINSEFTKGDGDKSFSFKIHTSTGSASYGYGIYGNTGSLSDRFKIQGLPDKSIYGGNADAGATGDSAIEKYFSDEIIKIGSYSGYLSILIDQGRDRKELRFPIKLKVLPADSTIVVDYCKTQVGNTVLRLSPCFADLTMIKGKNKEFSFKVTSDDGANYSYSIVGNTKGINGGLDYIGFPKYSVQGGTTGGFTSTGGNIVEKYFDDKSMMKGSYSGTVYIIPDINGKKARELRFPINLKVIESNQSIDYCKVELGGVTYSLNPCSVDQTVKNGFLKSDFNFTISPSTKDSVYGYDTSVSDVKGFPTLSINTGNTGGAKGDTQLSMFFIGRNLNKGLHEGYIPIIISNESGMKAELRFSAKIKVE